MYGAKRRLATSTALWPAGPTGSTRSFISPDCSPPAWPCRFISVDQSLNILQAIDGICFLPLWRCWRFKWFQNAGGVSTYLPLLMLAGIGGYLWLHHGSVTHFTWKSTLPVWNLDTVNFWSNIAFAFTGMELVCALSEEVREPRKTFPRAIYASAALIAGIYVLATIALLMILPAESVDQRTGVFQAITSGSTLLGITWFGVVAALLVTVGNAGGVGATVAGVARVPFVAGIDHYLPAFFGKIHPKWKTPYISILVQAGISALVLGLAQIKSNPKEAYQSLVDIATILYFIPFL